MVEALILVMAVRDGCDPAGSLVCFRASPEAMELQASTSRSIVAALIRGRDASFAS